MAEITELATGLRFPEGPVWMPDGTVLCVELARRTVDRVRLDGAHLDGSVEVIAEPGGSPNGLAIGPDGAAYVCNSGGWAFHELMGFVITALQQPDDYSGGRIERVDLASGAVDVLYTECAGNPLWGPNDLVFDSDGGMWFTDHGKIHERSKTHGGVYYARPDGSAIDEVIYPLDAPNGIGLSPDGSRLYVAETHTGRVFEWGVAGPGRIEKLNPASDHGGNLLFGAGNYQLFDSLAVDSAGNVVVGTLAHNAGLTVIAPDGSGVEQVSLPDPLCTNVCFGGDDDATAFVTLSATGRLASIPWPRPGLALAFG